MSKAKNPAPSNLKRLTIWAIPIAVVILIFFGAELLRVPVPSEEYQECLQDAQKDHTKQAKCEHTEFMWERTLSDPIAYYSAWLTAFTAVMAAIGAIQGYFTYQQIKLARDEFDLAQREYNATHRPRMTVRAISYPVFRKDVPVTFSVTIVNTGDNDGTIHAIGIEIIEHDGENGFGHDLLPPHDANKVPLKSGQPHTFIRAAKEDSSSASWAAIEAGAHDLIIRGVITYSDNAGIVRRTGFARQFDNKLGAYRPSKIYADQEYED